MEIFINKTMWQFLLLNGYAKFEKQVNYDISSGNTYKHFRATLESFLSVLV